MRDVLNLRQTSLMESTFNLVGAPARNYAGRKAAPAQVSSRHRRPPKQWITGSYPATCGTQSPSCKRSGVTLMRLCKSSPSSSGPSCRLVARRSRWSPAERARPKTVRLLMSFGQVLEFSINSSDSKYVGQVHALGSSTRLARDNSLRRER